MLKQEIEIFNSGLKLVCNPVWISSVENRSIKKHASAVIAFASKEEADRALKRKLIVAETSVHTAEYTDCKSDVQCARCQGFSHTAHNCKNSVKCQLCAGSHHTRDHNCYVCKKGAVICSHMKLRCANCSEVHAANSSDCEIVKGLRTYQVNEIDPISMESTWN